MSVAYSADFHDKIDGSLSHNHVINNFTSNDIIFAGKDMIVTGILSIYSDNGTKYTQVPITIYLMGKKVLGLMIDVNKTKSHFSSSNEMFGALISGIGLEGYNSNNAINPKPIDNFTNLNHLHGSG
jgi:hypothetical protein